MKGCGIALGGGARLNYEVAGGTTEPASPKENTIWVNTEVSITDVIFSHTEPTAGSGGTALSGGEIWVKTGNSSVVSFNALKKETLMVYPVAVFQYDSASMSFLRKEAKTYISGIWADWNVLYYDHGEEFADLTGGWTVVPSNATAVKNDTNIYLYVDSTGNAWAYTNNPVDITAISTLEFSISRPYSHGACRIGVVKTKPNSSHNPLNSMAAYTSVTSRVSKETPYSVDVSALTGLYYLVFLEAGEKDGTNKDYLYKVEGIQ